MADFYAPDTKHESEIDVSLKKLVPIVMVGATTGLGAYVLAFVISEFIISPLFCGGELTSFCGRLPGVSGNIALVFASVGGLFGLVKAGAYRALLIIIATIISLWGLGGWLGGLAWYTSAIISALLFGVAYGAFSWLARINNFIVSLGVILAVVILARVLPII